MILFSCEKNLITVEKNPVKNSYSKAEVYGKLTFYDGSEAPIGNYKLFNVNAIWR
jgi:hypothetical protein